MVRFCLRVLLPLAFVGSLVMVSQGVVQNFHKTQTVTTVEGTKQSIPGGPIASQEVIKEAGQNGGGPYNANSAHPYENPNPITNLLQLWLILAIPFAFAWMYGVMAKDKKQGYVVLAAMFVLWLAAALVVMPFEARGNPKLVGRGADADASTATQSGGNMEGKEMRFGPATSGLYAATHHRHLERRRDLGARQLHPDRRRGAAGQHDVRRGESGRYRLGPVRDVGVRPAERVHRRAHGRAERRSTWARRSRPPR